MKVVVFQPSYPTSGTLVAAQQCLAWMREQLDLLRPEACDLVLQPEYATAPGLEDRKQVRSFAQSQGAGFLAAVAAAAKRLGCTVGLAGPVLSGAQWYNRTLVFGPSGDLAATYDKVHLTDVERVDLGLSPGATIPVLQLGGIRFGFATCFDLYFSEHFEAIAAQGADVVLCPSYQRSESADRNRLIARARALDCGAYLVRSAYAMGSPDVGGRSLIAAPDGGLLADAGGEAGVIHAEIDPKRKFVKPASHGRDPVEHRTLIQAHRMPDAYRSSFDSIRRPKSMPLPHLCAHRGLSLACPENTVPAFAAAISLGVHEIEFDVKWSRDRVPVICHDPTVDRTTNGTGPISDLDWADLRKLDAGAYLGPQWAGVRMPRLEEVLDLAGGRVTLNVHTFPDADLVRHVCNLLKARGLEESAYLALRSEEALAVARDHAPEIPRACLAHQKTPDRMIAAGVEHGCERVQLFRQITESDTRRAHDAGLICNLFWSDEPEDARAYVRKGIDVILTNAAHVLIAGGIGGTIG